MIINLKISRLNFNYDTETGVFDYTDRELTYLSGMVEQLNNRTELMDHYLPLPGMLKEYCEKVFPTWETTILLSQIELDDYAKDRVVDRIY